MRALRWLRARPVLAAALLYAVLSVALVSPALIPGHTLSGSDVNYTFAPWRDSRAPDVREHGTNPELFDSAFQYQPWLEYTRHSLPDVPLWNPHISAGRPYVGNAQSAVFSPFSLPAYVFPFWWSLGAIAALKVFVSAFGTFLLARSLGARFPGSLFAGIVFGFGLWTVVWLSWPHSSVWALMPWLWLLVDRLVRTPGPLPAAGLVVGVALQYTAGHPESSFHVLAATTAFLVFRLAVMRHDDELHGRDLARCAGIYGAAVVGGTALAAVAVFPFVELLSNSQDLARRDEFGGYTLDSKFSLGLFLYGYWGQGTGTLLESFTVERNLYPGALTLLLSACALVLRPTAERLFLAGLGAFCLVMVFGVPPIYDLVIELPGFSESRNVRLIAVLLLCFALMSARGLDDLLDRRTRAGRMRIAFAIGAALILLPAAGMLISGRVEPGVLGRALKVASGFATPPGLGEPDVRDVIRLGALIVWTAFALGALGVFVLSRRRVGPTAVAVCALALVTVDLFRAGMGQNPAVTTDRATEPKTPAVRYLSARSPQRFAGLDVRGALKQPFPPDLAMRHGLYDARGYDFPIERRLGEMWESKVSFPGEPHRVTPTTIVVYDRESRRILDLLGVRSLLQDTRDQSLHDDSLRLAYDGPDARIYDNPRALPKVWLVDSQRVVGNEDAALATVVAPDFDQGRQVVSEQRLAGIAERESDDGAAGRARLTVYEPERVVARTNDSGRAVLVLNDLHFPGWEAEIDGRAAPIERVDYLLRGVVVPPGSHEVEFRYRPSSWRAGWIVSALALVGLLITLVVGIRRRPRARAST